MTRQTTLRSALDLGVAAGGGLVWIVVDSAFARPVLSDCVYWAWVLFGACVASLNPGFLRVAICALLASFSFAGVPAALVALGRPADFSGWAGFRELIKIGVPTMLVLYSVAYAALAGVRNRRAKGAIDMSARA